MSLDASRIAEAALSALAGRGFDLEAAPLAETGKSALVHLVEAVSEAVVAEIRDHAEVQVALAAPLASWMGAGVPVPTDGGAALKTSLIAAAQSPIQATGGIS